MAQEFLSSTYFLYQASGITDVQTVIDAVAACLVAAGWSDEGSYKYKTPVDGDGRFFKIQLSRVDATTLQIVVTDQNATTICTRRAYCSAVSTSLNLYYGSRHLYIDMLLPTSSEGLGAGMLDCSPLAQSSNNRYVWGTGYRSSAGSATLNMAQHSSMLDNVTAAQTARINYGVTQGGNGSPCKTLSGRWIYRPLDFFVQTGSINRAWGGRAYQFIAIASFFSTPGTLVEIPIDENGTIGQFRSLGGVPSARKKIWACRVG